MKKYIIALAFMLALPVWSTELKLFSNYGTRTFSANDKAFVEKLLQEIDFDEVAMDLMAQGVRNGVINDYLFFCKNNELDGHIKFTLDLVEGKFDSTFRRFLANTNGLFSSKEFAIIILSTVTESDRKDLFKLSELKSKFVNKLIAAYYLKLFIDGNKAAFENIGNAFYAEKCSAKSN